MRIITIIEQRSQLDSIFYFYFLFFSYLFVKPNVKASINAMQYSTMQYNAIQYNAIQYNAIHIRYDTFINKTYI